MKFLAPSLATASKAPDTTSAELLDSDPMTMVVRLARGNPTATDMKRWSAAAGTWLESGGDIPFERCLHLPITPDDFRQMKRDEWIYKAVKLLP